MHLFTKHRLTLVGFKSEQPISSERDGCRGASGQLGGHRRTGRGQARTPRACSGGRNTHVLILPQYYKHKLNP